MLGHYIHSILCTFNSDIHIGSNAVARIGVFVIPPLTFSNQVYNTILVPNKYLLMYKYIFYLPNGSQLARIYDCARFPQPVLYSISMVPYRYYYRYFGFPNILKYIYIIPNLFWINSCSISNSDWPLPPHLYTKMPPHASFLQVSSGK